MKSLTKLILFILSISYALTADGDLDAACAASDTCTDSNAECTSAKVCKCKSGYYKKNTACAANIALEADCTAADACIDNAECKDSKCKCKSGYYKKDTACAANVAPNADCTATDTCVDNAECKDSKCQCKSGYTAKDGKCESNENSNEKSSGISFLKVSIFSLLSLLF